MSETVPEPSVFLILAEMLFLLHLLHCYFRCVVCSCLINAQPLPAHSPAADDNSLIGCTSHDLIDDWSLASSHFGARLGAFFY